MYLDTQKLFEKALQAQHIDPAEVFKPEEEIEQIKEAQKQAASQGPPPDPAMAVAQLRAQAEMQQVQARSQSDMQELQVRQNIAAQEADMQIMQLQMTREIEMLKLSNTQNISLEKIKAQLADTAIKERSRKELFAAERDLALKTGSGI